MRTVAITGISGYIGAGLLARLEKLDEVGRVVGVDIKQPKLSPDKLKFCQQDIVQPLASVFAENEVDSALHLAFVLMPSHDRQGVRRINIEGTRNFLEACHNTGVRRIIYLSSHTVYGAHLDNPVPLTEDSPLRPLPGFQYSWDKAEAERLFQDFATSHPDVCVTILRVCVVMGPSADNAITRSLFKPAIIRVAGYDPPMQFLHEDDLTELLVALLDREQPGIFNVAGEGTVHYSELAALSGRRTLSLPGGLLRLAMAVSWRLHLQSESPVEGLSFIKYPLVVSTEKIKREAGFQFRYSSREAVVSYIDRGKKLDT